MIRWIWVLLFSCLVAVSHAADLTGSSQAGKIPNQIYYVFEDTANSFTIDGIRAQADTLFTPTPAASKGFIDYPIWLKVPLRNDHAEPQTRYLHFHQAVLYRIEVYENNRVLIGGTSIPFAERTLPYIRDAFAFQMPAHSQQTVFIKIIPKFNSTYSYDIFDSEFALKSEQFILDLTFVAYLTLASLALLAALMLFLKFRQAIFAYYATFVLAAACFQMVLNGYLLPFFDFKNFIVWTGITSGLALISLVLFIRSLYQSVIPRFEKVLQGLAWLLAGAIMAMIVWYDLSTSVLMFKFIAPLVLLVSFGLVLYLIFKRQRFSLYLFVGIGAFLMIGLIVNEHFNGLIVIDSPMQWLQVGSIIEIISLLGLVLHRIYFLQQQDKLQAEQTFLSLHEMQSLANVGSWVDDIPLHQYHLDKQAQRILGVDQAIVAVEELQTLLHPDDLAGFAALREEILDAGVGARKHFTFRIQRRDGETRYLNAEWNYHFDDHGQLMQTRGYVVDVTEQTLASRRDKQFHKIIEVSDTMIAIVSKDYRYLLVNQQYVDFFQRPLEQIEGRYIKDIHGPEFFASDVKPLIDRALAGETFTQEFQRGEQYFFSHMTPYRDELSNEIIGVVVRNEDVTERMVAQEKERILLARFDYAQRIAKMGHWTQSLESEHLEMSPNGYEIFELDSSQPVSMTQVFEKIYFEDINSFLKVYQSYLHSTEITEHNFRIVTSKGVRFIHAEWQHDIDETGKLISTNGVFQDMTEFERLRKEQSRLLERYRTIEKNTRSYSFIFNPKTQMLHDVEGFYNVLGMTESSVITGNTVFAMMDSATQQLIKGVIAGGKKSEYEYSLTTPHGKTLRLKEIAIPIATEDGFKYFVAGTDITEQFEWEAKRREMTHLLEMTENINQSGSWSYDLSNNHHVVSQNAKRMFGFRENEHVSMEAWMARVVEADRDAAESVFAQAIKDHDVFETRYRIVGKNQQILHIHDQWEFEKNSDGELVKVIGIVTDITDTVMAEEKAHEQEALLLHQNRLAQQGEMLQMIGHQWRQPLNQISLSQQLLRRLLSDEGALSDDSKQLIEQSIQATMYLSNTITDFKNFFSESKIAYVFRLDEPLNEALNVLDGRLQKHHVKVIKEIPDSLNLEVKNFKSELGQVINAIVNNAIDMFEVSDGEHQLRFAISAQDDANLTLRIEDNCGGIPDEVMPYVFDPYFSTKSERNGTGLGLYMTKMIMEKSVGGSVTVHNSETGAVFSLTIPREITA